MIVLTGGDLVLPDRVVENGSLLLDGDRIAAIEPQPAAVPEGASVIDVSGCIVAPGFIDVHVHGVDGVDTLDGGDAVARIAGKLPRYGVTAFCPTTVACPPAELRAVLAEVGRLHPLQGSTGARVLAAHLESNFINADYTGAQPGSCLRTADGHPLPDEAFTAYDILSTITAHRGEIGIVTLAPELPGGLDLVRVLARAGHFVSIGHTGATYEETIAAIEAGARHATHLFNRMSPLSHRAPGAVGAVLEREDVCAELICDGYHVHPAVARLALSAKRRSGIIAITDGTGAAGLPVGATATLGGRPIRVGAEAAFLEDGTLAGSTLTMDRAFRTIVTAFGQSIVDAVHLCSTTPARHLRLDGLGALASGAIADLVVLERGSYAVVRTFVDGRETYTRP